MKDKYELAYGNLDVRKKKDGYFPRIPPLKDSARIGTIGQLMAWCYKNSIGRHSPQYGSKDLAGESRIYVIYSPFKVRITGIQPVLWSTSQNLFGIYHMDQLGIKTRQIRFYQFRKDVLFREFNV
jgi:hypothetical protein